MTGQTSNPTADSITLALKTCNFRTLDQKSKFFDSKLVCFFFAIGNVNVGFQFEKLIFLSKCELHIEIIGFSIKMTGFSIKIIGFFKNIWQMDIWNIESFVKHLQQSFSQKSLRLKAVKIFSQKIFIINF